MNMANNNIMKIKTTIGKGVKLLLKEMLITFYWSKDN